jgi:hypothetical protein
LHREILGKGRYLVLLGWHVHTVCMLLLLGVLMTRRSLWSRAQV